MRRTLTVAAVLLGLALAGCGVQPSGVQDAGRAPARVAPGTTLYFVDAHDRLRPQLRRSDHIATIPEALAWLLAGPGRSHLHTEIPRGPDRVLVTNRPGAIQLLVPFTAGELPAAGIDQMVCTALAAYVQAGGSPRMRVQVLFTQRTAASDVRRRCPVLG